MFSTCEIRLPPVPLDKLKSVHFLSNKSYSQELDLALLFQYTDDLWSVSLRQADRITQVFEGLEEKIQPRHAVRRLDDSGHVYIIIETSSKSEIVKVGLSDNEDAEKM